MRWCTEKLVLPGHLQQPEPLVAHIFCNIFTNKEESQVILYNYLQASINLSIPYLYEEKSYILKDPDVDI